MSGPERPSLVVLEVADVDRSAALYRDAFGVEMHIDDHRGDEHGEGDRWISGRHAAHSWTEGAFLHFALYQSKGVVTAGAQIGFVVDDIAAAHERAEAAGVEVVHAPRPEPWGATARYLDLDGNVVSLTQR